MHLEASRCPPTDLECAGWKGESMTVRRDTEGKRRNRRRDGAREGAGRGGRGGGGGGKRWRAPPQNSRNEVVHGLSNSTSVKLLAMGCQRCLRYSSATSSPSGRTGPARLGSCFYRRLLQAGCQEPAHCLLLFGCRQCFYYGLDELWKRCPAILDALVERRGFNLQDKSVTSRSRIWFSGSEDWPKDLMHMS